MVGNSGSDSKEVVFDFFFFKQKTAYEMCGRDWSSDVCSSDLREALVALERHESLTPEPQPADGATYAEKIDKAEDRKSVV